jgi:putative DNA primase/helicase
MNPNREIGAFGKPRATRKDRSTDLPRAHSALLAISPNVPRDDWVKVAMGAHDAGIGFDHFDAWSSKGDTYTPAAARDLWKSIKPGKGRGSATLFQIAKQHGWSDDGQPPRYAKVPSTQDVPKPVPAPPKPGPAPDEIWNRAKPATGQHPYCQKKGIGDGPALSGLRVLTDDDQLHIAGRAMAGALVIPMYRPDGTMQSAQFIPPNGQKMTLPGPMENAFYVVGELAAGQPAYVCEGLASAWACWVETGFAGVVTFGAGRMGKVAGAVLEACPGAQLVLVPDVGKEDDADKVAAELRCAVAKMPEGKPANYDAWDALNDEHLPGAVALADVLQAAAAPVEAPDDGDGIDAPHASEIELAERFAERCAAQFRWTPGMDWMHNAGTHWERDDHLRRFNVAKAVCRGAAAEVEKPSLAAKLCSANTSGAVLSLARSEPSIVTPVSEWDKHPMLLNTPGDCYDLETGLPVSRTGLLFTQVTGAAPAHMPIPVWEKFISEVFDHDVEMIEFIQRLAGYTLTGSVKEQKIFFMHGEGANGKSVLLEVLRATAGRYAHNLPSEALMTAKHERHPTTFAALQGKRLAISSEIEESSHWAEARIKQLTGDATLTARYMRGDEFTFNVTHKHVLAGNFKPRLKGDDHAMVRRMVLIPFNQRFTGTRCDDRLPEKLKAEYPGILSWAIEGARKWAADGLRIPGSVTDSSKEYMAEQNDIELWTGECCNVGNGLRAKSSDLYASYAAWKLRNGENAGSSKVFSQRLERKFTKAKSDGLMVFKGLQLRPEHQQNDYLNQSRGF